MKVKEESEKAGIKLNIQKMKIMASGSIASWQINEETMKTVVDFISLGSKIIADGEIKRCFSEKKAMTNLDSLLKSRQYFADKGSFNQSYVVAHLVLVHLVKASSDMWM